MSRGGPQRLERHQVCVNEDVERHVVAQRRDAADGEAGGRPDEPRVTHHDRLTDQRRETIGVHAVRAARHHEHAPAAVGSAEHEALHDLGGGTANRVGRGLRGLHRLDQLDHAVGEATCAQRILHTLRRTAERPTFGAGRSRSVADAARRDNPPLLA